MEMPTLRKSLMLVGLGAVLILVGLVITKGKLS